MRLALCSLLVQGKSIPPAMLLLSSQQPQAALKLGDAQSPTETRKPQASVET